MSIHEAEVVTALPAVRERSGVLLMPVMDLETAKHRLQQFQEFCAHYLDESGDGGADGGDYGVIPGTKKKTLLKSGADKLCELYGLYDEYIVMSSVEDWDKGLFDYTLKCVLKSRRDDSIVGAGVGSCSSFESKYRWREAKRVCPKCGKSTIIKGQEQYGGGWICWFKDGKSDGCKAKFADTDKSITEQPVGRIENPDIIDSKNTVLKMAKKRAKIDAVIGVTRSSGIFTQDLEDIPMPPPKPTVERTTEPIPIQKPAVRSSAQGAPSQEGAPAAAGVKDVTFEESLLPPVDGLAEQAAANLSVKEGTVPEGCIDSGQQANFAKAFKDALPKPLRKDADNIRHEWLKKQGVVDSFGNGTSRAILKTNFYEVRNEAEKYAWTYRI